MWKLECHKVVRNLEHKCYRAKDLKIPVIRQIIGIQMLQTRPKGSKVANITMVAYVKDKGECYALKPKILPAPDLPSQNCGKIYMLYIKFMHYGQMFLE